MAGIKLKNIRKSYQVEDRNVPVLNGIDLDIPQGQITVILGQSGCGKTTLLRLTGGLEEADCGEVLWEGNHKTALVFQEPRLMPWLTLEQNILFGADKKKYSKKQLKERAEGLLKLTGLEKFGNAYPDQLSGGMMQRAALGRALACDASYLLMDEPFGALDAFPRENMQELIRKIWWQSGKTIFFITHDVEEPLLLGRRVLLLSRHPG